MTLLQFPGRGRGGVDDRETRVRIASSLDESLLVEAAAGTGKTTVLIERLVATLASGRAGVDTVVAVTFTRKAAGELKLRLREALDVALRTTASEEERARLEVAISRLEEARIGTIHSFCAEILRERPVEARVDPGFSEVADDEAPRIYRAAFEQWIQERLDEMTPGLRRALSRLALDPAVWEGSPLERLRQAGYQLAEWRDFPATWRREPFDRATAIDELVEQVRRLGELLRRGRPRDPLRRALEPVEHLLDWIERAQEAGWDRGQRDDDALEARLLDLRRELRKPWRTRKGSGRFAEAAPREQVLRARDLLVERVESFRRDANADLAALLGAELRGATERYEALKEKLGKLDFQDLLIKTRDLLRRDATVRRHLQARFTHLFVDEFQDTDPLQAEILLWLAADGSVALEEDAGGEGTADELAQPGLDWLRLPVTPGKLFLVGDPKQSIYRFRRADIQLYQRIKAELGRRGVGVVELSRSFRSVAPIQRFVNRAFAPQMVGGSAGASPEYIPLAEHRQEISDQPSLVALPVPHPYGSYRVSNESIDASLPVTVAAWLDWLLRDSGWRVHDKERDELVPVEPRHVCLLFRRFMSWQGYRMVDMTRDYTRALEARGIEHLLIGARTFHQREEVETLRAALTAIEWPDDELSVFATLRGSLFSLRDDVLLLFARTVGLHPLRWRRRAHAAGHDPQALGEEQAAVGEVLDLLAKLHRRRNARALVETLSDLLEQTRAHAGFALRPAGHQVLGNVERVLDLARAYELGGGRSFRTFVELLEEEADQPSSPQAPVVEEGAEGVRLMTVHTAKGLEYPVVVLADMTAQLARAEPSMTVDGQAGLAAIQLLGCSPHELLDRAEIELELDRAEGVRVAYVAATRARDMLVVPVVGDEKRKGWLEPLNDAVYPTAEGWRRPGGEAPGCPPFGAQSVLKRPIEQDDRVSSVRPGGHLLGAGPAAPGYEVVWWDPALLELEREPGFGLRQEEILAEDEGGVVALENRRRYEQWRELQEQLRQDGARPQRELARVTELEEDPPGGPRPVAVERLGRDAARPGGRRFGTLVHTVLQHVALAGAELLEELVSLQARALGATDAEAAACVEAVRPVLEHPLLARNGAAEIELEHELPFLLPLPDGRTIEGTIDLVRRVGDETVVVDYKTDLDPGERLAAYERQLSWYVWAMEQRGMPSPRGVLLLI